MGKYYVFLYHLQHNHRPYRVRIMTDFNPTVNMAMYMVTRINNVGLCAHVAEALANSLGSQLNIPYDTLCY